MSILFLQNAISENFILIGTQRKLKVARSGLNKKGKDLLKTSKYNWQLIKSNNFKEDLKKAVKVTKDFSRLYVNVGPGSYSGIRTAIAFALGYSSTELDNKSNSQIYTYTSFDLIKFFAGESSKNNCVFIQSWPRLSKVDASKLEFKNLKGYYQCEDKNMFVNVLDIDLGKTVFYLPQASVLSKFSKYLKEVASLVIGTQLDSKEKTLEFMENFEFKNNLEPLYINPVAITKPNESKNK